MTLSRLTLVATLTCVLWLAGCSDNGPTTATIFAPLDTPTHPWTHLNVNNGADTFQFAIVSDRTGKNMAILYFPARRNLTGLRVVRRLPAHQTTE